MRVLLLLLLATCGSPPAPQPPSNQAGSSSSGSVAKPTAGHAKVIQRAQTSGVIELVGDDRGAAMEDANKEMIAHCGPENYTIVQEGEEAVATVPEGGRTATAWRVHYECAH